MTLTWVSLLGGSSNLEAGYSFKISLKKSSFSTVSFLPPSCIPTIKPYRSQTTSTVHEAIFYLPFIPIPHSAVWALLLLVLNLYTLEIEGGGGESRFYFFISFCDFWCGERVDDFFPLPLLAKSSPSQCNSFFSSDEVQTMRDLSCIKGRQFSWH